MGYTLVSNKRKIKDLVCVIQNNGSIRKVNFQIASVCFWVLQKKVTKERRIFKAVQVFFFFFEITALRANFIQRNYRSYKTS